MATARRCAGDRIRNEHPARLKHAVVEAHADADHVFRCAAQAHFTLTLVSAQIPACAADVAPSDEPFQPCVQCAPSKVSAEWDPLSVVRSPRRQTRASVSSAAGWWVFVSLRIVDGKDPKLDLYNSVVRVKF